MSHRTTGIVLTCVLFVFAGISGLVVGSSLIGVMLRGYSEIAGELPTWLVALVVVTPFYVLFLGVAAFVVAYWLWVGKPEGRTGGIAWIALWLVSEVAVSVVTVIGPEVVQEVSSVTVGNFARIAAGGLLIYYLWDKRNFGTGESRLGDTA